MPYSYGSTDWGDLLTAYDGNTVTYDGVGNPISDGTWAYTWEHGRELSGMTNGATTWEYTYNADGLRASRTDGDTAYEYVYLDGQLVKLVIDETEVFFAYDAGGRPMSFYYTGSPFYYYVTNLQGDVVGIIDKSGNLLVSYTYDAWGKVLSVTGSMASTLGRLNPLTYRGYVYDWETGLYYLQSRYYNPQWGRFINADAFTSTGQGILGNNMFAYCGNNPVNCADSTGMATDAAQWWIATMWWLGLADSVLPIGDAVYGAGILFFELLSIGTISGTSALQPQEQEEGQKQADKQAEPLPLPETNKSEKKQVIFPEDPNDFNPVGLKKVYREGTKNGALISWMNPLTNTEVFRWDENPMYVNGPHYHIHGMGHYIPGVSLVPEPYATIYFPFGILRT